MGSSVVGATEYAVEWSGGSLITLEGLPGSAGGVAASINDSGVVVGESDGFATEWSEGQVINLGGLPGSSLSEAESINDSGEVGGFSVVDGVTYATEWSGGAIINLGGLPGATFSSAESINNLGQIVGESDGSSVPEPSTWAMMLLGFAGSGLAGCRRAKAGGAPRGAAVWRERRNRSRGARVSVQTDAWARPGSRLLRPSRNHREW